jgi:hypothetical protein
MGPGNSGVPRDPGGIVGQKEQAGLENSDAAKN